MLRKKMCTLKVLPSMDKWFGVTYKEDKQTVMDSFRQLILSGVLPAGDKMPSVRELAAQLTINPNTIQRAYRELETEGYICSVPGRGSFVSKTDAAVEQRKAELLEKFNALVKELRLMGVTEEELTALLRGGNEQ